MELSFTKMQGCANDYIYLDCRSAGVPENIAALSEKLSRRHFSIGADGIICICAPRTAGADAMMRIFNADGSEGRMCGNGIRCVAEWLYTHGVQKEQLAIDTLSGLKTVTRRGEGLWQVEMGAYSTLPADLPAVNMGGAPLVDVPLEVDDNLWRVTCINVGNPHCVTVVPDVDALRLEEIGPAFEHHANFPERINTEFVQVVDATHLKMRVWERGSGETWACGTGTCATVAAMTELGICPAGEDVHVQLRGGELTIRVLPGNELRMTGAAEIIYNNGRMIPCVLDNRITGMTGHQDNPGTGYTLQGDPTALLSVEKILTALGFAPVLTVDPQDLKAMKAAVDQAVAALDAGQQPAIVTRRPCLLIKRDKFRKGMCRVNADKCRSCRSCLKVGCPAISLENGKAVIDRTQCVGCTVCAQVCPFDAIEKEEK